MNLHLIHKTAGNQALIFFPGINSDAKSAGQLVSNTTFPGSIYSVGWDSEFSMVPDFNILNTTALKQYVSNYLSACKKAEQAGIQVADELQSIPEDHIYLVAHSMGTRGAYTLLKKNLTEIKQVVLMNGAVPSSDITHDFCRFESKIEFGTINYYNPEDPVLQVLGTYLSKFEKLPLVGDYLKAVAFFRPIGLQKTITIPSNYLVSNYQGSSHSFEKLWSKIKFDHTFSINSNNKENNMKSEKKTQSNEHDSKEIDIKKLDKKANSTIWKYSLLAGGSGMIPGIPESMTDSALQYAMLHKLETIYGVDTNNSMVTKMVAAVLDNIVAKDLAKRLSTFFVTIPVVGPALTLVTGYLIDFAYTFFIGMALKYLLRKVYIQGVEEIDKLNVSKIVKSALDETIAYIKENWKAIFAARAFVLKRYEVDMKGVESEFKETSDRSRELFYNSMNNLKTIYDELKIQHKDIAKYDRKLKEISAEIGAPSLELLLADARLAKMEGKDIPPYLEAILEMEKDPKITQKLLK